MAFQTQRLPLDEAGIRNQRRELTRDSLANLRNSGLIPRSGHMRFAPIGDDAL